MSDNSRYESPLGLTSNDEEALSDDYYSGARVAETSEIILRTWADVAPVFGSGASQGDPELLYKLFSNEDDDKEIDNTEKFRSLERARRWVKVISHATNEEPIEKYFGNNTLNISILSYKLNLLLAREFATLALEGDEQISAGINATHCYFYAASELQKVERLLLAGNNKIGSNFSSYRFQLIREGISLAEKINREGDVIRGQIDLLKGLRLEIESAEAAGKEIKLDESIFMILYGESYRLLNKAKEMITDNPQAKAIRLIYNEGIKETVFLMHDLIIDLENKMNKSLDSKSLEPDELYSFVASAAYTIKLSVEYLSYPFQIQSSQAYKAGVISPDIFLQLLNITLGRDSEDEKSLVFRLTSLLESPKIKAIVRSGFGTGINIDSEINLLVGGLIRIKRALNDAMPPGSRSGSGLLIEKIDKIALSLANISFNEH